MGSPFNERVPLTDSWEVGKDPRVRAPVVGVIHYTAGTSLGSDIRYLESISKDPNKSASYNAIIGNGMAVELLDPVKHRAWHAGKSSVFHKGEIITNVNNKSVGIAISNHGYAKTKTEHCTVLAPLPGTTKLVWWEPYEEKDIIKLAMVCLWYESKLGVVLPWVGHQSISPLRKYDPGPLFPWALFHRLMRVPHTVIFAGKEDLDTTARLARLMADVKRGSTSRSSAVLTTKIEEALAWSVYVEAGC